jgi:hypothetical protein
VDQNGYLVGGKNLAMSGSTGFVPENLYSFVGAMWNLGPDGKTYYPKYPLGLPALYALCLKVLGMNGGGWGCWAAYLVSPLGAVMALWGTYVLSRPITGAFGALMSVLVVGTSPILLGLANNPNSHASCLAFVVWGMAMLFGWWTRGGWWRAILAGFLCGYAVTIRYTEGLLLLPMGIVFLDRWFGRQRGAYWEGLLGAVGWCVPVGVLLWWNMLHFGSPTGYDSTRESVGFGWSYFLANWDLMLREMNDKGLVLVFPLGVAGMGMMMFRGRDWRSSWREGGKVGVVLAAWAVPCLLTYTAYYWAPETSNLGYSRFFLTILPALAVAGVWVVTQGVELVRARRVKEGEARPARYGGPLVAGVVVALAVATSSALCADMMIPDARMSLATADAGEIVRKQVPRGSVVFGEPRLLHHLQFVADYSLYSPEIFSRAAIERFGREADVEDPNPIQVQRASALHAALKNKTDAQMVAEQNRVMDEALASGKRVFFAGQRTQVEQQARKRFAPAKLYETKVVAMWQEPGDWRRNRWQRGNGNGAPTWAGKRKEPKPGDVTGQTWELIEVVKKVEKAAPTTRKK